MTPWNQTLFGDLFPSDSLLRRRKPGGVATPARQLDFPEWLCLTMPGGSGDAPPIQVESWIERVCKAMSPDTNEMLTASAVGERWAHALTRRFPGPHAAKRIARALGRDVRTAEAWLGGQAPYLHAALDAAYRLRDPVLLFELAGIAPPEALILDREIESLRADLDGLGERIARLRQVR